MSQTPAGYLGGYLSQSEIKQLTVENAVGAGRCRSHLIHPSRLQGWAVPNDCFSLLNNMLIKQLIVEIVYKMSKSKQQIFIFKIVEPAIV